jgi:hypothetical protein
MTDDEMERGGVTNVSERRDTVRSLRTLSLTALITAGLAIVLALFVGWTGWVSPFKQRLTAREFVLVSPDGSVRARWGVTEENAALFAFYDAKGAPRIRLTVQPGDGGVGITLADAQGRARAVLGLLQDQTSSLVFADGAGRTRAVLGLSAEDAATVVFADRDGVTRAGLGVDREGLSSLVLADSVRTGVSGSRPPETQTQAPTQSPAAPPPSKDRTPGGGSK